MLNQVQHDKNVTCNSFSSKLYLSMKIKEDQLLETTEIARRAVDAASDKQASNIVMLDMRDVCSFSDYFVISSGDSDRQIKAISEEIEKVLKQAGISPRHREGTADSGWMLLDFGSVIIHIFSPNQREFYQLEDLWNQAKQVVRIL